MIIPQNKFTQLQLRLWIAHAHKAVIEHARISQLRDICAVRRAFDETKKQKHEASILAHEEELKNLEWGNRFVEDILNKTADESVWLLSAFKSNHDLPDGSEEINTGEFSFLFLNPDHFMWNKYGGNKLLSDVNFRRSEFSENPDAWIELKEESKLLGTDLVFLAGKYQAQVATNQPDFKEKGKYFINHHTADASLLVESDEYELLGYIPKVQGNIIFNGAMINHGTTEKPEWSSHT